MPVLFETGAFGEGLMAMAERVNRASEHGTAKAAAIVERRIKMVELRQWGRHQKGTPTPSEPGTPPAQVTGSLRGSIKTKGPTKKGFGQYEAVVGPTMVYSRVQELGGGKMNLPARPYVAPALEAVKDEIRKTYAEIWREALL